AGKLVHRVLDGETVDWMTEYQQAIKRATDVFRGFAQSWYDGDLVKIVFSPNPPDQARRSIVSVLGGNVLNQKNPLVRNTDKTLKNILTAIGGRAPTAV
ncbi:MAG TPA: hypothetical protein VJS66_08895, partial [Burkholderiales bacterium]|nr:hypothetical protein [Burkholderiales bacterium]